MNPPQGQSSRDDPSKGQSPLWERVRQLEQFSPFKETPEQAERRTREQQRKREELERERLKAMPPEYVITLVHGTQLSRWVLAPLVSLFKWPKGDRNEFNDSGAYIPL